MLENAGPAWLFCPADRPERFGKAAAAADTAEQAADTAQDMQEQAEGVQADEEPLVDEAFDQDDIVVTAPRPAEAATELSER